MDLVLGCIGDIDSLCTPRTLLVVALELTLGEQMFRLHSYFDHLLALVALFEHGTRFPVVHFEALLHKLVVDFITEHTGAR
jgi:hypothetical protein